MPDGFKLGSAWIEVDPDADDFKKKLQAALDKDKTSTTVPVTPDSTGFKDKLNADLSKDKTDVSVSVNPDSTGFKEKLTADIDKDGKPDVKVKVDPDEADFKAKLDAMIARDDLLKKVKIGVDTSDSSFTNDLRKIGAEGGAGFASGFGESVGGAGGGGGEGGEAGSSPFLVGGIGAVVVGALASLPAILGTIGVLGGTGLGAGLAVGLALETKKGPVYKALETFEKTATAQLTKIAQPMMKPVTEGLTQLTGWISKTMGPTLETTFKESAKFLLPLLEGLEGFLNNTFKGLNEMLKVAAPFVKIMSAGFAEFGTQVGQLFSTAGPGLVASGHVFQGLVHDVGEFAITLVQVGDILANKSGKNISLFFSDLITVIDELLVALAPIAAQLLNSLMPVIDKLIKISLPFIPLISGLLTGIIDLIGFALIPLATQINKLIPDVTKFTDELTKWVDNGKNWTRVWEVFVNSMKKSWTDFVNFWESSWTNTSQAFINWFNDIMRYAEHTWSYMHKDVDTFLNGVRQDIINWFGNLLRVFTDGWGDVTNNTHKAWSAIANFFSEWWHNEISALTEQTNTVVHTLSSAWSTIESGVHSVWNRISSYFTTFWQDTKSGFATLVTDLGQTWARLENIFKTPVNYLIDKVYDDGIVKFWNGIVGAVGLGNLKLPTIAGLATGGVIPGYSPGVDNHLIAVSGGEGILVPEAVRALGPGTIHSLNAQYAGHRGGGKNGDGTHFATGGIPGGGVISDIGHAVSSAVSSVADIAKITAALATGNTSALTNGLSGLIGNTPATGELAKVFTAIPRVLVGDLVKEFEKVFVPQGSGGGAYLGGGSSNYRADITTVLKSMGLPLSLVSNWMTQIQTESGGNLAAVNHSDSNAAAGHPSVGLLQIIPSTFAAYAGPYRNTPPLVNEGGGTVSENAMAQIYAAIHYASAAYGGAGMANYIGHGHGYASGTSGAAPGWAWVGERGPELVQMLGGERVLPAHVSSMIPFSGRGYATGTEQKSGLEAINSLYSNVTGSSPSASSLSTTMTDALNAITQYYSGAKAQNLESAIISQTNAIANAIHTVGSITGAASQSAYASQITTSLSDFGDLSNLATTIGMPTTQGSSGVGMASAVYAGLQTKLQDLQTFQTLITQAKGKGVSASYLASAIAMGPDGGTQYLQAVVAATPAMIAQINTAENGINDLASSIGTNAASVVYGNSTGAIKSLGATLAKTIASDLKVSSSEVPKFALGGRFNAGTYALVGEQGPELVHFSQPGQVYPNGQMPAGGSSAGGVTVNMYGSQADPQQVAQAVYAKQVLLTQRNAVPATTRYPG